MFKEEFTKEYVSCENVQKLRNFHISSQIIALSLRFFFNVRLYRLMPIYGTLYKAWKTSRRDCYFNVGHTSYTSHRDYVILLTCPRDVRLRTNRNVYTVT